MAMVNGGYPSPPYGSYPQGYYPPQGGYPTYPGQNTYGGDAYSQGYVQGANGVGGTANSIANAGNMLTNTSVNVYGTMNSVIGTGANLLGTVSNLVTGLFGGTGYPQQGYYPQGQYPQQGQVGPQWGPDMATAQQQVWQQVSLTTTSGKLDDLVEAYSKSAQTARDQMQTGINDANKAIVNLQAAVAKLQAAGGPGSAQGQALLAEISTLKTQATTAVTNIDAASRKVYIGAYSAQMATSWGMQRVPSANPTRLQTLLGQAWSNYNGAPTERAHWYSLTKTNVPNALQMQATAHQSVTTAFAQLDALLKQQMVATPQQQAQMMAHPQVAVSSNPFMAAAGH